MRTRLTFWHYLIIMSIMTNIAICVVGTKRINDLEAASKAVWYELEQHDKRIKAVDDKVRPEAIQRNMMNWLEGK